MTTTDWMGPELEADVERLRHAGASVDLLLPEARGSPPAWLGARAEAFALRAAVAGWSPALRFALFGDGPLPSRTLPTEALCGLYLATAALRGLPDLPRPHPRAALELERNLERLLAGGLAGILRPYCLLRAHEPGRALARYGRMGEGEFASGSRHLPRPPAFGQGDLLYGVAIGWLGTHAGTDGGVSVEMTELGAQVWDRIRDAVGRLGLLQEREQYLGWLQAGGHPSASPPVWPPFAAFARLRPGMRVVSLGTASGGEWLPLAAAQHVGPRGTVLVVCGDRGTAERIEARARRAGLHNLRVAARPADPGPSEADAALIQGALGAAEVTVAGRPPAAQPSAADLRAAVRVHGRVAALLRLDPAPSGFLDALWGAVAAVAEPGSLQAAPVADPERAVQDLVAGGWSGVRRAEAETILSLPDAEQVWAVLLGPGGPWRLDLSAQPWAERQAYSAAVEQALAAVLAGHPPAQRAITVRYALVRGHRSAPAEARLEVGGGVTISPRSFTIYLAGRPLIRSASRGAVLAALVRAAGRPRSGRDLARATHYGEQTVYNAIRELRAKLPPQLHIELRRGQGYVLRAS
jgi:biotin operon repressor